MEENLPALGPRTTEKQRRFFEIWGVKYNFSFDHSKVTSAYREAGFAPTYAAKNVYTTLYSSNLNKAIRAIMERKNITLEKLVDKLVSLLDAKHPFAKDRPDNIVQLKAFQDSMKILGGYPIPVQKVDVRRSEEYHISIEDQRKANEALADCIDVEPIEDGTNNPAADMGPADRPFR